MKVKLVIILLLYSVQHVLANDQLCTTTSTSISPANVTRTFHRYFDKAPRSGKVTQGEAIFQREQSKFNVSKQNGFLLDEEPAEIKKLISAWEFAGYLTSVDSTNFMYAYNNSLSSRGYGEQLFGISAPDDGKWSFHRFMCIRKPNERLIVAYSFLILKLKDTNVKFTIPENRALMRYIDYEDRTNFNDQQAAKVQQFLDDFEKCH